MLDWVASQRNWLSIEPLPGYAPDLNPIEQVWGRLKSKELANLCTDTMDEIAAIAECGLDRIGDDASLCLTLPHSASPSSATLVYAYERQFKPAISQSSLVSWDVSA
ncbi:MAG: transposase [Chloroflexota bacterium]